MKKTGIIIMVVCFVLISVLSGCCKEHKPESKALLKCEDKKIEPYITDVKECLQNRKALGHEPKFYVSGCCIQEIDYLDDYLADSVRQCVMECRDKNE